jgi:hypothetical protein
MFKLKYVIINLCPYSQHFNFFVTYELAQKAREFVTSQPFQHNVMEYSCLLVQFVSYEENKVLWIRVQIYSCLITIMIVRKSQEVCGILSRNFILKQSKNI